MHLGWIVRVPNADIPKGEDLYEVRARKGGVKNMYRVVLSPILHSRDAGQKEITVGMIMKWHNDSWTIIGDELIGYHGVRGMATGYYAAFHLLQEKGYIGWDRSC